MRAQDSFFANLTPLKSFDPRLLRGDKDVPQEVCNLVLALACFFNDWKDMQLAFYSLSRVKPSEPKGETPAWGEFNGLVWHLIRLQVSSLHETLSFVKKTKSAVEHPYFQNIIQHLPDSKRQVWNALADASSDAGETEFGEFCMLIRNKVAFHYDGKTLFQGYSGWFLDPAAKKKPYLSRGTARVNERFYFAEASAQSYFESLLDTKGLAPKKIMSLCDNVGQALSKIVKDFIDSREVGVEKRNRT
ncbi:MAG: hypothetical protein V2A71_08935 [Candidatus Eisenbacteria bacterium]